MTNDQIAVILYRLSEQDKILAEIARKATDTNGRVTDLEKERVAREAVADLQAKHSEHRFTLTQGAIIALLSAMLMLAVYELLALPGNLL